MPAEPLTGPEHIRDDATAQVSARSVCLMCLQPPDVTRRLYEYGSGGVAKQLTFACVNRACSNDLYTVLAFGPTNEWLTPKWWSLINRTLRDDDARFMLRTTDA